MCVYIGMEDLAANALIEIFNHASGKFVSFKKLENYGAKVVNILFEKGEKAILILSRENTDALFRNYSEFFEETQIGSECGIALRENITVEKLEEAFRGYLALDVLLAFIDKTSIIQLGIGA